MLAGCSAIGKDDVMVKPNHICKYSECRLGIDENGNPAPKQYYACDYCDRIENWKSMACCFEHYQLYIEEVIRERAKGNPVAPLPSRTDKSEEEVKELMGESIETVKERTEKELAEFADPDKEFKVDTVVEKINEEIDKKVAERKSRQRKEK